MKAMVFSEYGSANMIHPEQLDKPTPKNNQVLIKLKACSINDWDWGLLTGKPLVNRMLCGIFRPKRISVLGSDIAGIIESVGQDVKSFKVGDEVIGDLCGKQWGGFAEYVSTTEDLLTLKPSNMTFEDAAALPQAATLAWQGLTNKNQLSANDKILINGAGGGSGSFAIQIAKYFGAEVTAVDSSEKLEFMKSLGADHVIDYKTCDFTQNEVRYDVILDLMGHHKLFSYRKSLTKTGRYLLVGGASELIFNVLLLGPLLSLFSEKQMSILVHEPTKGLNELKELYKTKKIKPIIDRCFPFNEVPSAMEYFGQRKTKGKIVITI
ncbi:NAD(P)-dependent alcohol dehydrogenase [Colwelliaceae bacterium 6441]